MKFENNEVLVWIPVHNEGAYIASTVDSILRQTYPKVRILISNNHSQDDTEKIIGQICNLSDRVISIKPPKYLATYEHLNFVMSQLVSHHLSGCDFLVYFGGHDQMNPDYIANAIEIVRSIDGKALVVPVAVKIDKHGLAEGLYQSRVPEVRGYKQGDFTKFLNTPFYNSASSALIPKQVFVDSVLNGRIKPCVGVDLFWLAELSVGVNVIRSDESLLLARATAEYGDRNRFFMKHLGCTFDFKSMMQTIRLQLQYLNQILDKEQCLFAEIDPHDFTPYRLRTIVDFMQAQIYHFDDSSGNDEQISLMSDAYKHYLASMSLN